jgi:hypothetical protein
MSLPLLLFFSQHLSLKFQPTKFLPLNPPMGDLGGCNALRISIQSVTKSYPYDLGGPKYHLGPIVQISDQPVRDSLFHP